MNSYNIKNIKTEYEEFKSKTSDTKEKNDNNNEIKKDAKIKNNKKRIAEFVETI